jgi:hypothetical protein
MASPKRTAIQIENDRREIAAMYLEGKTQQEIADALAQDRGYALSRQMIGYDLQRIQEQWLASALRDFDDAKAQELAKIDHLERTYWDGWERSCEDAETLRVEGNQEGPDKKVLTRKGQAGDPRFLQGVERCIERRCKILGIDAPTRMEHTGRDGGPIETETRDTTPVERRADEVMALLDLARARSAGAGAGGDSGGPAPS